MKYKFNSALYKQRNGHTNGDYIVDGELKGSRMVGRVIESQNAWWTVGAPIDVLAEDYFVPYVAPKEKPFRDLRGRFAKKKQFQVFLREIRVVTVDIEAASAEDAETLVKQGDGNYDGANATHSDLCADEYFHLFERPTEEIV